MEKYEVIVIGAGASGLATSWFLTKEGFKVACFEQGDFLNKEKLVPIKDGGELQKYNILSPDPNIRSNLSDYPIDCSNSPIEIANYNGVGGSTILFSGQYPRLKQSDFKVYSNDGIAVDWPIRYEDLLPFFNINDELTGVSGLEGDIMESNFKATMPPLPFGKMGRKLIQGFENLNWHWWPAYSAINSIEYDGRPADDHSRPSNMGGDINGGKGSTNHTYLPRALKNGLILKTKSRVIKLIKDENEDKIKRIIYLDQKGSLCSAEADIFVLAASGIGTPKLLLNSNQSDNRGIANSSDLVGRNLMLHPLGYVEGHFRENLNSNIGPQGCCILSQEFYSSKKDRGFLRGYTFQVIGGPLPIESALNLTSRKLVKFGKNFISEFQSIYNHTAHLTVISEDLPEKHNRVTLSKNVVDKFNILGVDINYKISENTKKILSHGLNNGRIIMKASGAYKSFASGPVRNTGWHTLGTCCMGDDPKKSVVNSFGKTHDIQNLFIVDGSIFPTSGGVNPASTIQSLALYISNNIKERYSHLISK